MAVKWQKTKYPGIRFYDHESRIHKRRKDRYHAIRYYRGGERVEEGLGWISNGMTLEEAQTIRGEIVQNIKKGVTPQSFAEMREIEEAVKQEKEAQAEAEKQAAVTFGQVADLFLEWSENNKKSYRDDKNRYEKHLEKRFKDIPIKDISPFHLEKLKSSLKKGKLSPATITQYLQLTRAIYRKTKTWGHHDCDFPKVDFPKVSNQRVAFLMPDRAEALLYAIKEKSTHLWCQCVLALYAGLRFGEIAALELSDIDLDAGTIHVRDSKGGTRHAYITKPIRAMLEEWWTFTDKKPGLLFPARASDKQKGGKQIHGSRQKRVSPVFARTVDELKFNNGITDARQRIVYHSLRHSFASWLVMGGESLQTVMELMGHKDITTTMRYSHLAPDIKRNAVNNLVATLSQTSDDENKVVNLADKK